MTRPVRLPSLGTVPKEWGVYAQQWLGMVKTHLDALAKADAGVTRAELDAIVARLAVDIKSARAGLSTDAVLALLGGRITEAQLDEELADRLLADVEDGESLSVLVDDLSELVDLLPIENGGTNARTKEGARASLDTGIRGMFLPFSYGDATPATIGAALANKPVTAVELVIVTPFDGAGAALTVGDIGAPAGLMAASDNDPTEAGSYAVHPAHAYGADTSVLLTISPGAGATQGSGLVIVHLQEY